jgi:hypothetical protein
MEGEGTSPPIWVLVPASAPVIAALGLVLQSVAWPGGEGGGGVETLIAGHLGNLVELTERVAERASIVEKLFTDRKEARELRAAMLSLLDSMTKPAIPAAYTALFSLDAIDRVARATWCVFDLRGKLEEVVTKGVAREDLVLATLLLRGMGMVEVYRLDGCRWIIGLTALGELVKDALAASQAQCATDLEKVEAMLLSSLPFSTKMRVVYGLMYMHGVDYPAWYSTLRNTVFGYDPKLKIYYYYGIERAALEVLYELALTRRGASERFISETQLLADLLFGYLEAKYGGDKKKLNEVFVVLNKHIRRPHVKEHYEAGAWEALAQTVAKELDEVVMSYRLERMRGLFDKLRAKFEEIEFQFQGLNGLLPGLK